MFSAYKQQDADAEPAKSRTHMVVEIRPTNHMRPLCFHMLWHPGIRSRHAGGTTLLRHLLLEWSSDGACQASGRILMVNALNQDGRMHVSLRPWPFRRLLRHFAKKRKNDVTLAKTNEEMLVRQCNINLHCKDYNLSLLRTAFSWSAN